MKRASLLVGVLLLVMAAFAPAALAGEVKGPPGAGGATGGPTPIDGFWTGDGAASICSFSGLNDVIDESEPTLTQSYGTFLSFIMRTYEVSAHEAMEILEETPADMCNPRNAPFGNPKKP